MTQAKDVAWGYVTRDIGKGKEILVARRHKLDDPHRQDELVLPGGMLEGNESYSDAAIREVLQETGIRTVYAPKNRILPAQRSYVKPNLYGRVHVHGVISLTYRDSGKVYAGRLTRLFPVDPRQEPTNQENSDARDPQYMPLLEAFGREKEFTPACQILLDIIRENQFRTSSPP